jgi:hypothetical protein
VFSKAAVVGIINHFIFKALIFCGKVRSRWYLKTCRIEQSVKEMSAPLKVKVLITVKLLFSSQKNQPSKV